MLNWPNLSFKISISYSSQQGRRKCVFEYQLEIIFTKELDNASFIHFSHWYINACKGGVGGQQPSIVNLTTHWGSALCNIPHYAYCFDTVTF